MLSHWGIQHFHLGDVVESDGFVKRTKELLFVHFSRRNDKQDIHSSSSSSNIKGRVEFTALTWYQIE